MQNWVESAGERLLKGRCDPRTGRPLTRQELAEALTLAHHALASAQERVAVLRRVRDVLGDWQDPRRQVL